MSDYQQIESSQRQHNEAMEHESRYRAAQIAEELAVFVALKPTIKIENDKWCVRLGSSVCLTGFGKSPIEAIRDFNATIYKQFGDKP